ncbi:MAG: hypothetical protein D6753_00445 [Planctomycetota bacterium]|nr:MAG: hypothetical protein D6753_00445 [Planctomycetota bacterium]
MIVLLAATGVPGINESHYLPKAKHFWDPTFAPRDLFLTSHDSHFLTSATAGLLTVTLPLAVVAWLGRLAAWSFMAFAWGRLTRCVGMVWWQSWIALAGWYVANHYGHWAGEWFLGGFEAKAVAYPSVVMAMTYVVQGRWTWVWPWLGFAVAWHPVVGGWAGLSTGLVWWWENRRELWSALRGQMLPLVIGTCLALIGIVPALGGLGSPNREGTIVASQVQVYYRLAHHLCPRLFAPERHWAAATTVVLFLTSSLLMMRGRPLQDQDGAAWKGSVRLVAVCWTSVGIALIGLLVDALMSDDRLPTYQPEIASQILRFYWFRWSDVAVPLGIVVATWLVARSAGADRWSVLDSTGNNQRPKTDRRRHASVVGVWWSVGAVVAITLGVGRIQHQRWNEDVAPADRLVATPPGPHAAATDRLVDWIAVCTWIRENAPTDSLWLTPKYQQTFKWYAGRSEVVNWKDVPQDNRSVIEWFRRIRRCEPPRDARGKLRGWTTDELLDLAAEYDAQWILVDRSIQQNPPLLEIRYPIDIDNRSFAVFFVDSQQIEKRQTNREAPVTSTQTAQ